MNLTRRKQLRQIKQELISIRDDIDGVILDEDYALNATPENLQGTERFESYEAAVDELGDVEDDIADAIKLIDDILSL